MNREIKYRTTQERIKPLRRWIVVLALLALFSVLANFLQLADRKYQQKKINSLYRTATPLNLKSDAVTYGLYHPKHKNK
jgi:hypothetical protein